PEAVTILGVTLAVCFASGAGFAVVAAGSPGICTGAWAVGAVAVVAAALVAAPALAVAIPEMRRPSVRVETVIVRMFGSAPCRIARSHSGANEKPRVHRPCQRRSLAGRALAIGTGRQESDVLPIRHAG